jgi:signal transduction histidine kinase
MYQGVRAGDDILVVEDDADLRETLVELLRANGYHSVGVENGKKALDYLRTANVPSLILLDLMMPEMNGWQFRLEQKKNPAICGTPVVVLSADDSPQAAAIDADLYVKKPIDLGVLLANIEHTLRDSQARRVAQAERMVSLGTLAAGVAHEINNPLAYVIANLDYLSKHASEFVRSDRLAEVQPVLAEAMEGAERIRGVIQQVNVFSADDSEERRPLDVRAAIESAVKIAFNEIRHRARLVRDYRDVPSVMASEGRLTQVFTNLLVNAAQAIPEGNASSHAIRVATRTSEGGRAIVEVSDTGAGIPPQLLGRIFEPFFTTKRPGSGTGLGLSICYGIIHSCGGEITAESELGRGSTFRISLPPAEVRRPDAKPVSKSISPLTRRARVLVIDDEPAILRAVARSLRRDHEVVTEESGKNALQRLESDRDFDVILCDLMMPTMSGSDVYEAVRSNHPGLERRIVFMTGGVFTDRAKDFLGLVPNACIAKPLELSRLNALIAESISDRYAAAEDGL